MLAENAEFKQRQELEAKCIAKAWKDDNFKQELLKNPNATFAKTMGLPIPANVQIKVLAETSNHYYLVIPKKPEVSEELSDEALEAIAGGVGGGGNYNSDVYNSQAR